MGSGRRKVRASSTQSKNKQFPKEALPTESGPEGKRGGKVRENGRGLGRRRDRGESGCREGLNAVAE